MRPAPAISPAVLWSALAVALGAPLYALLDAVRVLPVELRDRPWPLEALAIACCLAALTTIVRAPTRARLAALCACALNSVLRHPTSTITG